MKVPYLLVHENAVLPVYSSAEAAGADMTAVSIKKIKGGLIPLYEYDTGVAINIPKGYFGMLAARSSVSKKLMWLANGVGVIDSDYTGTIRLRFRSILGLGKYEVGERIGQLLLVRRNVAEFGEVKKLSKTVRGSGGFGHTGN